MESKKYVRDWKGNAEEEGDVQLLFGSKRFNEVIKVLIVNFK